MSPPVQEPSRSGDNGCRTECASFEWRGVDRLDASVGQPVLDRGEIDALCLTMRRCRSTKGVTEAMSGSTWSDTSSKAIRLGRTTNMQPAASMSTKKLMGSAQSLVDTRGQAAVAV